MNAPRFTPGPWPIDDTGDYKRIVIGKGLVEGPNGYEVAEVYSDDCPREVAEANANLIAAAPELYALVKAIDDMWSDDGDGGRTDPIDARSGKVREIWSQMRATLAKARGEQVPA